MFIYLFIYYVCILYHSFQINRTNVDSIIRQLGIAIHLLMTNISSGDANVKGLEKIRQFLSRVFLNSEEHLREQYDKCNKVLISEDEDDEKIWRILGFWCLSPGMV